MVTLYRCMTKAVCSKDGEEQSGFGWVTARRGILTVTDRELQLTGWVIRYDDIDEAVLLSTRQWLIPGYLLRVRCRTGTTYLFGLNWGRFWKGALPFPVRRGRARTRLSPLRLIIRGLLLALLIYIVWRSCFAGGVA